MSNLAEAGPGGQSSRFRLREDMIFALSSAISLMNQRRKRIDGIRNNPKDVRFDDACAVAEELGFVGKGGRGSHHAYSRPGEPVGLNFQNRNGYIPPFQARQLIEMIEKYGVQE